MPHYNQLSWCGYRFIIEWFKLVSKRLQDIYIGMIINISNNLQNKITYKEKIKAQEHWLGWANRQKERFTRLGREPLSKIYIHIHSRL